jgi:ribosomal protein S18 acetylase RimI-like enzyme
MGRYYVKWLDASLFHAAEVLECYSAHRIMGAGQIRQLMTSYPRADGYVVTNIKNEVLAFILFRRHIKDQKMHFIDLVVHPDYRRKGFGSMLVARMKAKMNGFDCILAPVRDSNFAAHKFLYKHGFVAYHVIKDFFTEEWPDCTEQEDAYAFIYSPYPHVVKRAMRSKNEA